MTRVSWLAGVLSVLLAAAFAQAAIHRVNSAGSLLYRTDASNIQFYISNSLQPGATNSNGNVVIAVGSDVVGAANRAGSHWNSVSSSAAHFAAMQSAAISNDPSDGKCTITIEDTPENRSVVGSALAITVISTDSDGAILDSDIILSPDPTDNGSPAAFSTLSTAGTFDLEAVITHELGHALGEDHTGALSAIMYAARHALENNTGFPDATPDDGLSADEVSFATSVYPANGAAGRFGSISGTVTSASGGPIGQAAVIATELTSGKVLCALTGSDGAYAIASAPPGTYRVYTQPLGGLFPELTIYSLAGQTAAANFKTTFFGGNGSPASLVVAAGQTANANITAGEGADSVSIQATGTLSLDGLNFRGAFTGVALKPSQKAIVLVWGPGIDGTLGTGNVVVLGPNVQVVNAGPAPSWLGTINGWQPLEVTLNISAISGRADLSLGIAKNGDFGFAAAALEIFGGGSGAVFDATEMKNAGSYSAGAVAPGEMFALFGSGLGPSTGVLPVLASNWTMLPTQVGGVQVLFDGVAAPLVYASNGQINGVVPFEVAGKTQTTVVVSYNGASTAVSIPVHDSVPSIFTANASGVGQGAVINQDNTVNSASHPAHPGDIIAIYGTGFGQTNPAGTDGLRSTSVFAKPLLSVSAQVAGASARVHYAGAAPGFVAGFMQVNVGIPCTVKAGPSVPIAVQAGNNASQTGVTIAVTGPPNAQACP